MPVIEELRNMSDERFLALYEALSERGYGPLDGEIARDLKFRPQSIKKLPLATRARRARKLILDRDSQELAYEFVGQYLVRTRKELVTGFLDATGVPHEEGMIEDLEAAAPDGGKIPAALEELEKRFEREDLTLYLALCAEQWPGAEALLAAWRGRTAAALD